MSTQPILSINRCFADLYPMVTEVAQQIKTKRIGTWIERMKPDPDRYRDTASAGINLEQTILPSDLKNFSIRFNLLNPHSLSSYDNLLFFPTIISAVNINEN